MAGPTYELVDLCPAEPGWRAVYSAGGGATVPIVAWGVFRRREGGQDKGTSMEGVIADFQPGGPVRNFECARAAAGFEGYLPPH